MPPAADPKRVTEVLLRLRMYDDVWENDANVYIRRVIGKIKKAHWGNADVSQCLVIDTIQQLCVQYTTPPVVRAPSIADGAAMTEALASAQRWSIAATLQELTELLREMLLQIEYIGGRFVFTLVTPDRFDYSYTNDPLRPTKLWIWQDSAVDGGPRMVAQVWDITNPDAPLWYFEDAEGKRYPQLQKGVTGYPPAWYMNGKPIIPAVVYHAKLGKRARFDYNYGHRLIVASLGVALLKTYGMHIVRDAAFPWRALIDGIITGQIGTLVGSQAVDADPGNIANIKSTNTNKATIAQWGAGADPKDITDYLHGHVMDAVSGWGLHPADVQVVTADPRSGTAITVSRASIRERQFKNAIVYGSPDTESLRICATLADWPIDGWGLSYGQLALSIDEQLTIQKLWSAMRTDGAASLSEYIAATRGVSQFEATRILVRIDQENLIRSQHANTESRTATESASDGNGNLGSQ